MRGTFTRKDFLRITGGSLAGAAILGVAGCGGGTAGGEGTLRYAHFLTPEQVEPILKDYEQSHANVKIKSESTPGSGWVQYLDKIRTAQAGGEAPDMFLSWGGTLAASFINSEQALNLDSMYEKRGWRDVLVPLAVESIEYEGSVYGVPIAYQSMGLWYRKDTFNQVGLEEPRTYDELEDVNRALKAEGISPLSLGGKFGWNVMRLLDYFVETTAGPEMHDRLNALEARWDSTEVVEAYELLKKWTDEEWIVPGFLSVIPDDARIPWYQGDAAMVFEGNWMEPIIKETDQDLSNYTFFVPPTEHEPLRFSAFPHQIMISSQTDSEKAVADFLDWYIQPKIQKRHFALNGSTATVGGIPEQGWELTAKWQDLLKEHPTYPPTDQVFDPELMDTFFAIQADVVAGKVTPQEAGTQMQTAVEEWKSKNA